MPGEGVPVTSGALPCPAVPGGVVRPGPGGQHAQEGRQVFSELLHCNVRANWKRPPPSVLRHDTVSVESRPVPCGPGSMLGPGAAFPKAPSSCQVQRRLPVTSASSGVDTQGGTSCYKLRGAQECVDFRFCWIQEPRRHGHDLVTPPLALT